MFREGSKSLFRIGLFRPILDVSMTPTPNLWV